ncbi:hypothetical protein V511_08595 [Mesotoga sp. Brook.08.YT.4.2.5.1]|nr:hypothetical protein V511_08595 [Mesotoga sp. Brook.08.YT.4.2.5.1]PXF34272.1 hypothetical protein EU77_08560 [Mesotoga sp. SC_NapDC]RAO96295.1 hypothetical protein M388_02440 [Mesotoga sp. Brook.08.YT.4.2.5.4.]RDI92266.1 hypothetical protein Q502_09260 [Mesotoga sp. Brook.08.YT.4.2.5.2.]
MMVKIDILHLHRLSYDVGCPTSRIYTIHRQKQKLQKPSGLGSLSTNCRPKSRYSLNAGKSHCPEKHLGTQGWRRPRQDARLPSAGSEARKNIRGSNAAKSIAESEARWREEVMLELNIRRKAGQERPRSQCPEKRPGTQGWRRSRQDARLPSAGSDARKKIRGSDAAKSIAGSEARWREEVMPGETSGKVMPLRRKQKKSR